MANHYITHIIFLFFILLLLSSISCILHPIDHFQSYAEPWNIRNNWDWNWWRRWYKNPWWKPRCPVGCQWVGGKQTYGCPNGNFCYGNYCCKYDSECQGCSWPYDGIHYY